MHRGACRCTETNRIHLVLFGLQNRTLCPYLAAIDRILTSLMPGAGDRARPGCSMGRGGSCAEGGGLSVHRGGDRRCRGRCACRRCRRGRRGCRKAAGCWWRRCRAQRSACYRCRRWPGMRKRTFGPYLAAIIRTRMIRTLRVRPLVCLPACLQQCRFGVGVRIVPPFRELPV
jgi:hypothetical protein